MAQGNQGFTQNKAFLPFLDEGTPAPLCRFGVNTGGNFIRRAPNSAFGGAVLVEQRSLRQPGVVKINQPPPALFPGHNDRIQRG